MFNKQAYVLGVVALSTSVLYSTNFKLKDESVRGSHDLGKLKLLHHDKRGYTLFADGKKHKIQPHQCSPEMRSLSNKQLAALTKAGYISVAKQSDGELSLKPHVRGNGGMMGESKGRPIMLMGRHSLPMVKGPAGQLIGEAGGEGVYYIVKTGLYALCGWAVYKSVGGGSSAEPVTIDQGRTVLAHAPTHINEAIENGGLAGGAAAVVKYGVTTAAGAAVGAQAVSFPAGLISGPMNNSAVMEKMKASAVDFNAASITTPAMGKTIQMAEVGARNFFTTAPVVTAEVIEKGAVLVNRVANAPTIKTLGGTAVVGTGLYEFGGGCLGKEGLQNATEMYNQFTTQAASTLDKYALPAGTVLMGAGSTLGPTAPGCGAVALDTYLAQQGITLASQTPTVAQAVPVIANAGKDVVVKGIPAAAKGLNYAIEGAAMGAKWVWKAAWSLFPY